MLNPPPPPATETPSPSPTPAPAPPTAPAEASGAPPTSGATWADALLLGVALTLLVTAAVGLVLAMLERFSVPFGLALGVPPGLGLSALLLWATRPWARPTPPSWRWPTALALALAAGFFLYNGAYTAQRVIIDRDPAVYATTGRWLAGEDTLLPDPDADAFAGVDGVSFGSVATFERPDGRLEFQFQHAISVLLAEAFALGGQRAMFRLTPLVGALGLFGVFLVARRVLSNGWLALAAMAMTAVTLPQLIFSRDTYSEPYVQLFVWSALLALGSAFGRRLALPPQARPVLAFVGGLLAGGALLTRIDGIAALVPLPLLAGLRLVATLLRHRESLGRDLQLMALTAVGVVLSAGLGWIDLAQFGTVYWKAHAPQVRSLVLALVASIVAGLVVVLVGWLGRDRLRTLRLPSARVAAVLAAVPTAVLTLAWLVRPVVQTGRAAGPNTVVAMAQEADGLPVDPTRTYDEETMVWLSWYLSAVAVALALLGVFLLTRKLLRGRGTPLHWLFLATFAAVSAIYLVKPSITPDQIWAMRRFLPVTLPGLAVLAAVPLAALARAPVARAAPRLVPAGLAVVVAVVLALEVRVVAPVHEAREQFGNLRVVEDLCGQLPPQTAVLVVPAPLGTTIAQSVRAWCEVPVALTTPATTPDDVQRIAADVAANGWGLTVVARAPESLVGLGLGTPVPIPPATVTQSLERRIAGPPDDYLSGTFSLSFVPLVPPPSNGG